MAFGDASVLLDNFNRANTTRLTDPNWGGYALSASTTSIQITSNQIRGQGSNSCSNVWSLQGPNDQEAYMTIASVSGVVDQAEVLLRWNGVGNCYAARFTDAGGASSTLQLYKVASGSYTQIGSTFTGTIAATDKFGLGATGTTITLQHFTGGSWNQRTSGTDSTYAGGLLGLKCDAANNNFDDFFGTHVPPGSDPQWPRDWPKLAPALIARP